MSISLRIASESEKEITRALVMSTYMKHGYLKERADFLNKISRFCKSTITILAENHNDLIGTLSVILDSEDKLPLDALYPIETHELREQGRSLCELSQFAVTKGGMKTSLLLCKYAKIIALNIFSFSDFVITANPKHYSFYTKVLKFSTFASEIDHPHLDDIGAAPLRLNLLTIEEVYRNASGRSRFLHLHDHFFGDDIYEIAETLRSTINTAILNHYHGGIYV